MALGCHRASTCAHAVLASRAMLVAPDGAGLGPRAAGSGPDPAGLSLVRPAPLQPCPAGRQQAGRLPLGAGSLADLAHRLPVGAEPLQTWSSHARGCTKQGALARGGTQAKCSLHAHAQQPASTQLLPGAKLTSAHLMGWLWAGLQEAMPYNPLTWPAEPSGSEGGREEKTLNPKP